MNLNKVMLIGNLTRDPESRATPNGQNVANFGLATNATWKDQNGEKKEKVEFHNIVAWGKLADICSQYLVKGKKIYIEGRLQTRDWQGQDGVKKYRTEIVAENMIMLDRAGAIPTAPREVSGADTQDAGSEEVKVEEIPF